MLAALAMAATVGCGSQSSDGQSPPDRRDAVSSGDESGGSGSGDAGTPDHGMDCRYAVSACAAGFACIEDAAGIYGCAPADQVRDITEPGTCNGGARRFVDVPVGSSPTYGSDDAPVAFVVFYDYQDPFSGRLLNERAISPLVVGEVDTGRVRMVFKQHPQPFHPDAHLAAEAALAAHEQGKFLQYHYSLLRNQGDLSREALERWAVDSGLNVERFRLALDEHRYRQQVEGDLAWANERGIVGTPTTLIDGYPLSGAQPWESFRAVIACVLGE